MLIPFLLNTFRSAAALSLGFLGDFSCELSELDEYDESESDPLESDDPDPEELLFLDLELRSGIEAVGLRTGVVG